MKKKENKFVQKYVPILAITFVVTLLAALGAFRRMDRWAQDKLLQRRQALGGNIVVLLNALGQFLDNRKSQSRPLNRMAGRTAHPVEQLKYMRERFVGNADARVLGPDGE